MRKRRGQAVYRFGEFSLDLSRAHLRQGDREIELRPQSYEVLKLLVANAGQLVTRQQFHDEVWGDVAVTDDSLAHCISDVRKALNDSDRTLVRTVPRRGYLFSGKVESGPTSTDQDATRRRKTRAAIAAIAAMLVAAWAVSHLLGPADDAFDVPPNSIAVLPFQNDPPAAGSPGQPGLGAAFSDQLRDQLSRVPGLRLAARSSSIVVAGQQVDAREIAERLGVAYIVEGSYFADRNAVRVTTRLIDGSSGLSDWSDTFDRRAVELIQVQQAIAEEIVARILPDAPLSALPVATLNPSANQLLILARHTEQQVRNQPEIDLPKLREAIAMYRQATELDPSSARAFSHLADALLYSRDVAGAEAPILRAVELDPDDSEVQDTLGKFYWASRQEGAGAAWKRAIELNPNNAEAHASYGYWLWLTGNNDVPERYFREALSLDRESLERYWELGNYLGTQGKTSGVRELIEEVLRRFRDPVPYELLSRLHEFLGEVDHAIAWTLRARDANPDDPANNWRLAELYSIIGEYDVANSLSEPDMATLFFQRRYEELIELGEDMMFDVPEDAVVRYLLAIAYNAVQDHRMAARVLESTDLLESIRHVPPAEDIEAWMTYMNALDGLGRTEELDEHLEMNFSRKHVENSDWWPNTIHACMLSMAGGRESAVTSLLRIKESARIPWYPVIYDSRCFEKLSDSAEYAEVTEWIEEKRADQRARLDDTLDAYNVSL